MNNNNTQIFKLKDNKIQNKLKYRKDFKEKEVQTFYEKNLDKLLDAKFVATEFAFDGGRIDTFAVDNDNNPLIIEYKKDTSDSVLLQALYYKEYIQRNWEKGYYEVVQKLGQEIADEINWRNIRVVLIAQDFDKWTKASTTFLNNVDLYHFSFFEEGFIQEYVNESKKYNKKNYYTKTIITNKEQNKYPFGNEADFSKEEIVISKKGKETKTCLYYYNQANKNIQKIYNVIIKEIENLSLNYEMIFNQYNWYVKAPKKFVEFYFIKDAIVIQLYLKKTQNSTLKIEDVSEKGRWGTFESRIRITNNQELEEALRLIKLSYENIEEKFS